MMSSSLKKFSTLAATVVLALWPARHHAAELATPDVAAMQEIANMGEGFVIWERALNGAKGDWQIWMRPLDPAGKEERLVPAEADRDHFCPKISPDGTKLIYMSYKRGEDAYDRKAVGSMWIMDLATRRQTMLFEGVKSYQEDRAVVWFDNTRFCYLDEDNGTNEFDLSTGKSKQLVTKVRGKFGYLVNATQTFATSGDPEFAPFDADSGVVDNREVLNGCQPYFTQDGKWGYWMSSVGGPVSRFFLPTRVTSPIVQLFDPRLPTNCGYIYFPMISSCMRLFACAGSPGQHDHYTSNYNILISRIDPGTLELIGKPVRYSFFKGTDRYPDVFAKPLPLGSTYTEGPAHLTLQAPDGKSCQWRVDGNAAGTGATLDHFFETEGDHWVEAQAGGKPLRGFVYVRHPVPPALVSVSRGPNSTLVVSFNKPVSLTNAKATIGETVLKWKGQEAADHIAILELPPTYISLQDVLISGVRDKAEVPNELAPTQASVSLPAWPSFRDELVFAWENHLSNPLQLKDTVVPEPHGKAYWNAVGGMDAGGGYFELPDVGEGVMRECGRAHAFTLEAILTPRTRPTDKVALPIFSLENKKGKTKFALLQKSDGYYLFLATEMKDKKFTGEQRLAPAIIGKPQHLVVSYDKGDLSVFLNGSPQAVKSKIDGRPDFEKGSAELRAGISSDYPGAAWIGGLDHFAFYHRVFTSDEVVALYDYAAPKLASRSISQPIRIAARLIETSKLPTLEEIKPYHEALAKNCYEVLPDPSAAGKPPIAAGSKVVITHWVLLNGESVQAPPAEKGKTFTLDIEPLAAHPEVKSLVTKDDLTIGLGSDEYLDVTGW